MISETLIKGMTTELKCIASFIERGYQVSIPYGNCSVYDFVVDTGTKFLKMQCKGSIWYGKNNDRFYFGCRHIHINTKKSLAKTYTKDDIDYFVTYFEGKCYVVPVEECGQQKILRIAPTKNGNMKNVNWAKDYEIDNIML